MAWHWSRRADLGLRAAGLLLCGLGYTALARLVAMHVPPQTASLAVLGLAAIVFIGASGGSAMLFLGSHLFDEIEVSARWRPRPDTVFSLPREGLTMIDDVDPAMLVVGRDVDGSWTVRERAGLLLGRFCSADAAQRFARAERHGKAAVPVAATAGTPPRIQGRLTLGARQMAQFDVTRG